MAKLLLFEKGRLLNFALTFIASLFLMTTGWGQIEPTTAPPNPEAYSLAGYANPTVTSDKDDYAPGETAIITGTGWNLDSTVDIHLEEEPSHDHHHGYHGTVVDANGNWRIEYPIEGRHIGVKFKVIVDGVQSRYQGLTYFTDANFEFAATGLPNGTPNSTLITVRYKIDNGFEKLYNFEFKSNFSDPRIAVMDGQTIVWTYDDVVLNGITYSAPGGSHVGNANEGVIKISSIYSKSCISPSINSQPTNTSITYGMNALFFATTSETVSSIYQWQVNVGSGFTDIINGEIYSGVNTATLSLTKPAVSMRGFKYRVIITNSCGQAISDGNATLTVNKKSASIVVADKTKEYGSSDPTLDGTLDGFLTADGVTAAYSRAAGETVIGGPYAITAVLSPAAVLGNYEITNTSGKLSITKKSASVVVADKTKEYGSSDPTLDGTLDGFLTADGVTAAYSRAAGETVIGGPYTITAVLSPAAVLGNYEITNTPGALSITKKAASVVVADKTKEYGSADPELAGTLDGFLFGDNVTASYSRVTGETVAGGPYAITATLSPAAVLGNYEITNTAGALSITKKAASVVVADKTKEYGSADPALTGNLSGFLAADGVTASYGRVAGETVLGGPYAITATLSPAAVLSNYEITNTAGALSITKKAASVVVADKTKEYGSADPVLTGTLDGFLSGDNVTASYSRVTGETVLGGPYAITATLSPAAVLSNYKITNTAGALSITKKAASVVVADKTKEYGSADPVLTGTLDGFLSGDNVTASYSRVTGETVAGGPYAITATLTPATVLGNYEITNTAGALSITKKAASVVVADKTKEYGSSDPTLDGTLDGFLTADGVTAAYSRVAGETVAGGPYAITATLTPATVLGNYEITNTAGALSITKKAASVVVADKTKEYGSADPELAGTLDGFLSGDNVTASYSRVTGETVAGGPYAITATLTPATVLGNYEITNTAGALTISKAALTITANNKEKFCGQTVSFAGTEFTQVGLVGGDAITSASISSTGATASAGINNSPYAIIIGSPLGTGLGNYEIAFVEGNLTIKGVTLDASNAQTPRSNSENVIIDIKVTDGANLLSGVLVKLTVGSRTEQILSVDGIARFTLGTFAAGLYSVSAQAGGCSITDAVFLPIYDPNGGFVTGGGWIESPATAMASGVTGRANFGFNAKYKTGRNNTTEVDGHTNFQFKAGDLHFSSSVHHAMSLVVSGAKATYTGEGTITGMVGSFEFRLIAVDGELLGSTAKDRFRIKILTKGNPSDVVYDNERGVSESADATTDIAGGSIVIHKPKAGGTKTAETIQTVNVEKTNAELTTQPATLDILGNLAVAPNPVQTEAKVRFSLIEDAGVNLRLFDFNGREIYNLYSGNAKANEVYEVGFQRNNLMSGIYIVKLTTDRGQSYTKNVIVE